MSDSNLAKLSYAKEATWGTVPAVQLTDLRITGDSLMHGLNNIESQELRSDRMTADLIQVGAEVSGGFEFELSYGAPPNDLLEGMMFAAFGTAAAGGASVNFTGATGDITVASGDNSVNSTVKDFLADGFRPGQIIRITDSASNDGYHKVSTVIANKIVMLADYSTLVTETGAGLDIRMIGTVDVSINDVTVTAAGPTFVTAASDWEDEGVRVGQWVEIRGFTETGNNGYFRVSAVSTVTLTVEDPGGAMADEASGDAITVKGSMIRNGIQEHYFTVQRHLKDVTQFFAYRGCMVNTFDLNVAANEIVTGSFDFMGADIAATDLAQTSFGTGLNIAAPSNSVLNAVTNVSQVMEGSTLSEVSSSLLIQSIDFSIANNLRAIPAIGTLGSADVGVGHMGITGNMNSMFLDESQYDKFLAGTETGISFKLEDSAGNAYIFTFPRIKYVADDGGKASGLDQDIVENLSWQAIRDATTDCQMQIDVFPA